MMLLMCWNQHAWKFGKLSSGRRTGKDQFLFQSQRKSMPKIVQTTAQLHSSHTLAKWCSKFQARLQQGMNSELPGVQAGFRNGRGARNQNANIHWIIGKTREFQENYLFFIDYTKAFDCVDHRKLWKILKEMGNQTNWIASQKSLRGSGSNS